MNIREQLHKTRHGPICNFGGDSEQKTESVSNNYDQRSIVTQTLDGGAIADAFSFAANLGGGALGMVSSVAGAALTDNTKIASQSIDASTAATAHAYDYADNLFSKSIGFAAQTMTGTQSAYDHAAATETAAIGLVQNAYADAKGTSAANQKIMLAVIAVAAFAVLRKG